MKPLALASFAVLFFASAASAMSPETAQYLRQIGLNPEAKEIVAADKEGPVSTSYDGDAQEYSLDTLAAAKKKNGISSFIGTRSFIRRAKQEDESAPIVIPKANYDPIYLTPEERGMVGKRFARGMTGAKR